MTKFYKTLASKTTSMLPSVRTAARPPELVTASTRAGVASHVVAAAGLLNSVPAIWTFLRILLEPLHCFSWRRTRSRPVVVIPTFGAVAPATPSAGTCHAPVPHVLLGNNCDDPALTVEHSLGCRCNASVYRVLPPFDPQHVPAGQCALDVLCCE